MEEKIHEIKQFRKKQHNKCFSTSHNLTVEEFINGTKLFFFILKNLDLRLKII